jgi:hypothetical protein
MDPSDLVPYCHFDYLEMGVEKPFWLRTLMSNPYPNIPMRSCHICQNQDDV